MALSAGLRIAHYEVTAQIGQGGMGEVYKARCERLTEGPNEQHAHAFSPDGTRLVFREDHPENGTDLGALSLDGERASDPLVATDQSNASGQDEIYVRPFPNVDEGRWQISTGGGTQPLWAPDGRELLYRAPGGAMMAVPVQTEPTFTAGNGEAVFEGSYLGAAGSFSFGRTYDVAPDGQRFLMIKQDATADETSTPDQIIVVEN